MRSRWITVAFLMSLGLLVLTAVGLGRKPLCIDSRFVERIDRIGIRDSETIYRCQDSPEPAVGRFFVENTKILQSRIEFLEERLWRLAPWLSTVKIVVLESRPWAFRLQGRSLYIGEKMLQAEGHFERGLIKTWLRDQAALTDEGEDQDLQEEVFTDWLWADLKGQLFIEDPLRGLRTKVGAQWPQVVKDEKGYCASPWRLSEHFEGCLKNPADFREIAPHLSLRSLLSTVLIRSFDSLNLSQQMDVLRSFPRSRAVSTLAASGDVLELGFWKSMSASLRRFSATLGRRDSGKSADYARWSAAFSRALKNTGFEEARDEIQFDVLIDLAGGLEKDDAVIQDLAEEAEARKTRRIAVRSGTKLWILPSRHAVTIGDMTGIKAEQWISRRCDDFDFKYVLDFENRAQKVVVIDDCASKDLSLRSLLRGDMETFAKANKDVSFVQFHVPSLSLRKDAIDLGTDVRKLIQHRDISDPVFQTLGWQELKWSEDARAYRPRAYVDAIEWFRLN